MGAIGCGEAPAAIRTDRRGICEEAGQTPFAAEGERADGSQAAAKWLRSSWEAEKYVPAMVQRAIDQLDHRSLWEPFHMITLTGKRPMKRSLAMISSNGILTAVVFPLLGCCAIELGIPRRDFDRDFLHDVTGVLHSLTYLTDRCFRREVQIEGRTWRLHRDFDNPSCLTVRFHVLLDEGR